MIHTSVNLHETKVAENIFRNNFKKIQLYLSFQTYFCSPAYIWGICDYIHSAQIPMLNYVPVSLLKRKTRGSTHHQKSSPMSMWNNILETLCFGEAVVPTL